MVSLSLNWLNRLRSLTRHASQMADAFIEVMGVEVKGQNFSLTPLIELPLSTLSVIVDTWHCFDFSLFSVTPHSVPSALTSVCNEKLPTGCSLSVLHYRANAASPVPTAVGSFTTSLPCAFPPFTPLPPIPSNESRGTDGCVHHIVPPPSGGISTVQLSNLCKRGLSLSQSWNICTPTRYCFTQESQWVQGLFIGGLWYIFALRGSRFTLTVTPMLEEDVH